MAKNKAKPAPPDGNTITVVEKKSSKQRIDQWLVELGLVETREKAKALIMAGQVLIGTQRIDKPGHSIGSAEARQLALKEGGGLKYVGRGGLKLEHALDEFGIDPAGKLALDVGASTGGFTDCLLQRKARKVIALDVGQGQLAWRLQTHPDVFVLDKTNVRYLEHLPETEQGAGPTLAELVVMDVSFISLKLVLPAVRKLIVPGSPIIALVKPQFEAGKERVGKGGIIKDPKIHRAVLEDLVEWWRENRFRLAGLTRSPILGAEGNTEFLALLLSDIEEIIPASPGTPVELVEKLFEEPGI